MSTAQVNPLTGEIFSANYARLVYLRTQLPVYSIRRAFFQSLAASQCTVVVSVPGAGTQIPQWAVEYLFHNSFPARLVACTQPHRTGIIATARRVAAEMDVKLGEQVGYSIRFDDCSSARTVLKYCTDGTLLRETMRDRLLDDYGVIVIDNGLSEEWTLQSDAQLALLKQILPERPDLKIVVIVATIESAVCIHRYLDNCALLGLPVLSPELAVIGSIPPTVPRSDFVSLVLTLKRAGVRDLNSLDFFTKPAVEDLAAATAQLQHLGALDENGALTDKGVLMTEFPLVPAQSAALIAAVDLHLSADVLTIVAMLAAVPRLLVRDASPAVRSRFYHSTCDYFTAISVYSAFRDDNRQWFPVEAIDPEMIKKVETVREQLANIMDKHGLRHISILDRIPDLEDCALFMKVMGDLPVPTL